MSDPRPDTEPREAKHVHFDDDPDTCTMLCDDDSRDSGEAR